MPLTKRHPKKGEMKNLFKKVIVPQEKTTSSNGSIKRNFTQAEYDEIYGISKN